MQFRYNLTACSYGLVPKHVYDDMGDGWRDQIARPLEDDTHCQPSYAV